MGARREVTGSPRWRFRHSSFILICILMAAESVAANVVHPVEPAFYLALDLPDWIFGAAFAAMAFGLFALAPFWGLISDRIGRGPTLAIAAFTYGLSQLAFLVSTTVPAILIARFAAGATCSGCGVAAMAYVADVSDTHTVGRRMTLYTAVTVFATAFGYLIGGLVGNDDPGHSFILQFLILAVVALLSFLLIGESPGFCRSKEPLTLRRANPLAAFAGTRYLLSPWMIAFLAGTLCASLASAAFDNSFNYYLRDQFAFPSAYNGYIYAAIGILGFIANLTIGLRLQRSRDGERSLGWVLICAAVLLASTMFATTIALYLGLNIVFYLFNSMYLPLMQAFVIRGHEKDHGTVSGLFQSVKSLGMVVGALAAGFIYEADPLAPFAMAAVAFAVAAAATFAARGIARRNGS